MSDNLVTIRVFIADCLVLSFLLQTAVESGHAFQCTDFTMKSYYYITLYL